MDAGHVHLCLPRWTKLRTKAAWAWAEENCLGGLALAGLLGTASTPGFPVHTSSALPFPGAERLSQGGGGLRRRAAPRRVPLHSPAAALPLLHHHHLHPQPQVRGPAGRGVWREGWGRDVLTKHWQVFLSQMGPCHFPRLLPSILFEGSGVGQHILWVKAVLPWGLYHIHIRACTQISAPSPWPSQWP